jgi:hypothetical protein
VLESSLGSHNYRGWMTQFNGNLTSNGKKDGSFGWDITPSIVPASMVPSYAGSSQYLIATKYNNYQGLGDGVNKLAILDPNAQQADPITPSVQVMKEVLTIAGVTPDPTLPAVREWCINTAAIDPRRIRSWPTVRMENSTLGHEHQRLHVVTLTRHRRSVYADAGRDGTVYAVNNAALRRRENVSTGEERFGGRSSWTGPAACQVASATANFRSVINTRAPLMSIRHERSARSISKTPTRTRSPDRASRWRRTPARAHGSTSSPAATTSPLR